MPIECPNPLCENGLLFFVKKEAVGVQKVKCPYCRHSFCLNCNLNHSRKKTCEEFAEELRRLEQERKEKEAREGERARNEEAFELMIKSQHFARCPVCSFYVEKNSGCNCMRCRSPVCKGRVNFCYLCSKRLDNEKGINIYRHFDGKYYGDSCRTKKGEKDDWE